MAIGFVFPGQGSQAVGMGRALHDRYAAAKAVFAEVDDALSAPLSRLIFEGPEAELTRTENAQPALMAVSLAVVRALEAKGVLLAKTARCFAGHSLGEYSALAAAGAFTIAETARLLRARGRAMQAAVPEGVGAMAALLGIELAQAEDVALRAAGAEVCVVANDNAPGQVVVSGHKSAVERAVALAAEAGARRSVFLPVSAPFHCPLMRPAAEAMAAAFGSTPPRRPARPLIANVTASPVEEPESIRRLLVEQVTARVRWRESVAAMRALGVDRLIELGAGKVLSGLGRRIDKEIVCEAVGTPDELDALVKSLSSNG
ncbi:MAG: [acyl-carrier-protein] S-malonyltransferase [Alphaproteobacteria bacterium]|nr:[acyl-carrier-protein] S-malonyltransferase [Alphaproteobacteria bacterium]